jgi:hypothetical protein
MFTKISPNNDAEAIATDDRLIKSLQHLHFTIPSLTILALLFMFIRRNTGRHRCSIGPILILDLPLLRDYVLEVLQFELEQEEDGHGGLWLPQVVQHLEKEEERLHLQEGFNVLYMLQKMCQEAQTATELLSLIAHSSAVVQEHCI